MGADLTRGTYIEAVGEAYLPDLGIPRHPLMGLDDTVAALEAERDRQQQVIQAFGGTDIPLTLLIMKNESMLSASVINRLYVRPGIAASYLGGPQVAFGLMEGSIANVPLFTLLYMRPYL